ncbi:hypothetical protein L3i20_v220410 [Paenibacillus sp. L3-i20]|nr:hypothetical protein L3i20_v220410 [Paenibacillus sp. L3-i20]
MSIPLRSAVIRTSSAFSLIHFMSNILPALLFLENTKNALNPTWDEERLSRGATQIDQTDNYYSLILFVPR